MTPPTVAFCRTLTKGVSGADVVAHKRALSRWQPAIYPWGAFTDNFGSYMVTAVKAFQLALGIAQSGVIGSVTHSALERVHRHGHPDEWAFDAVAIQLAHDYCQRVSVTQEMRRRQAIIDWALLKHAERDQIAYSQRRPFAAPDQVPPSSIDCSGFVTDCYRSAGAPDPNGRGYDGQGYTGTLVGRGAATSAGQLKLGDLAFYGFTTSPSPAFPYGSPTHVAIVVQLEPVGLVVSMGSSAGPSLLEIGYRTLNSRTPFRTYAVGA